MSSTEDHMSQGLTDGEVALSVDYLNRENKLWRILLGELTKRESLQKEINLLNTENENQAKRIQTLEAEARESREWHRQLTLVLAEKKCCTAKDNIGDGEPPLVAGSNNENLEIQGVVRKKWWQNKKWIAIVIMVLTQLWQIVGGYVANVAAGETTTALHNSQ